ncbi:MAG: restriction endonuclease [Clostridia bacterium]|nr:restriction endonuclease [Clostridia bacterium]
MRKTTELTSEEFDKTLNDFYYYFENGYAFEEFLKAYLEKIGLDEVRVTQRSSDGGIDLEAIRYGVGGLDGDDSVEYFVQAKRNKPGTTIPIEKVRALRGVMKSGDKGLFITTASFSVKTKDFIKDDLSRPIILIDGRSLIESCIDNEIGFVYKPVFSKDAMDELKNAEDDLTEIDDLSNNSAPIAIVDKQITANDIRARILRMPKALIDILKSEQQTVNVSIDGSEMKKLRIDKTTCFLSGVTELYRNLGLIRPDGTYVPKKSIWKIFENKVEITLKVNE